MKDFGINREDMCSLEVSPVKLDILICHNNDIIYYMSYLNSFIKDTLLVKLIKSFVLISLSHLYLLYTTYYKSSLYFPFATIILTLIRNIIYFWSKRNVYYILNINLGAVLPVNSNFISIITEFLNFKIYCLQNLSILYQSTKYNIEENL